jgi:hypothetical protein
LKDIRQMDEYRQIGGYPADWRISGRLEDFRQIGEFSANSIMSGRLK